MEAPFSTPTAILVPIPKPILTFSSKLHPITPALALMMASPFPRSSPLKAILLGLLSQSPAVLQTSILHLNTPTPVSTRISLPHAVSPSTLLSLLLARPPRATLLHYTTPLPYTAPPCS